MNNPQGGLLKIGYESPDSDYVSAALKKKREVMSLNRGIIDEKDFISDRVSDASGSGTD